MTPNDIQFMLSFFSTMAAEIEKMIRKCRLWRAMALARELSLLIPYLFHPRSNPDILLKMLENHYADYPVKKDEIDFLLLYREFLSK